MRASIAALVLLLLVSAAGLAVAGDGPACKGGAWGGHFPYPSAVPAGWEHDRFGTWPPARQVGSAAFVSAFAEGAEAAPGAPYRGLPRWVAYEMRALRGADGQALHAPGARRPSRWYELDETRFVWEADPAVDRPGLDPPYRGEGAVWNRGHIAPRAHADRLGWEEGCNSHVFVNAVPQHATLNQGDWAALENYAAALANRFGRVWTIAGPLVLPDRPVERIGAPGEVAVAIPHAMFKILVVEIDGRVEARGFVFPQADAAARALYRRCAGTPQEAYDLDRWAVPIAEIEAAGGLRFFTRLREAERAALVSGTAPLWPVAGDDFADRCGPRSRLARETPAAMPPP